MELRDFYGIQVAALAVGNPEGMRVEALERLRLLCNRYVTAKPIGRWRRVSDFRRLELTEIEAGEMDATIQELWESASEESIREAVARAHAEVTGFCFSSFV